MLLNNFWQVLRNVHTRKKSHAYKATKTDGGSINMHYNSGYLDNILALLIGCNSLGSLATGYTGSGVIFGTGTTPPNADDYCLSGEIVTGITGKASRSSVICDEYAEVVSKFTITNDNSDPVTIGEVGYLGSVGYYANANTTTNSSASLLLDRVVLAEPVTIPAGGVGQITYAIRLNTPTA